MPQPAVIHRWQQSSRNNFVTVQEMI